MPPARLNTESTRNSMDLKNGELTFAEAVWMCQRHGFVMRHESWPDGNTIGVGEYSGLRTPFDGEIAASRKWSVGPGKVMPDINESLTYTEALQKLVQHGGVIVCVKPDGTGTVYPLSAIASGVIPCEERRGESWLWRDNAGRPDGVSEQDRELMEQALKEASQSPPEQGN